MAIRLALRTVASSWFATTTIRDDGLERIEHRRIGARHVQHDVTVVALGELEDRPDAPDVHRRQHHAVGRRQKIDAALGVDDQVPEERLVEPVRVLERVDDRESRLGAEEHGGIAVGHVQIDEQRAARFELRQRRRDVDGDRRRADAALGADERVGPSRRSW